MRPRILALALVLLAPAALARPFVTWDDVGVAQQGSVEEWQDAFPAVCPDASVDVRVTLTVLGGDAGDVLTLRLPDWPEDRAAEARLGTPGIVDGTFSTSCSGRFFVEGTSVAAAAAYAWHAETR